MASTMTLKITESEKSADNYSLILSAVESDTKVRKAEIEVPKMDFAITPDPVLTIINNQGISNDFHTIGEHLYKLIHRGSVGTEWDKLKGDGKSRLMLDIEPPEIARLPWELICNEADWLGTHPEHTIVRKFHPTNPVQNLKAPEFFPLRILIFVGSIPDDPKVSAEEEIRQIRYDIRNRFNLVHRIIDLEIVHNRSLTDLGNIYTAFKPHIFHFIGHGGFDPLGKPSLILNFFNAHHQMETKFWDAASILTSFNSWGIIPRFVFLNACRSNVPVDKDTNAMAWSVGQSFRRLNVPAVLTMQADIKGKIAGVFAGALYKFLAELDPLDKALVRARAEISNRVGLDTRDWATPVLTVAVPPEDVFSLKPPVSADELQNIIECQAFEEIEYFSARVGERRKIIQSFYPPPRSDRNLIIIKGGNRTGKSSLAKLSLQICALLNQNVRYVEVGDKTWLDVLLNISCGNPELAGASLIYQPLLPSAFEDFNWNLKQRLSKKEPSERNGAIVSIVNTKGTFYIDGDPMGLPSDAAPTLIEETFKSFRESLTQAAKEKPLVIVLDRFSDIRDQEVSDYLIPLLIQPIAAGELADVTSKEISSPVKFVMVFNDDEFRRFNIQARVGKLNDVTLEPFDRQGFYEFFKEFLYYVLPDEEPVNLQTIINNLKDVVWKNKQEFLPELVESFKP